MPNDTIRVYTEDRREGEQWVADGPGCAVTARTADLALSRYFDESARNRIDTSSFIVEYGHYERVWVKDDA